MTDSKTLTIVSEPHVIIIKSELRNERCQYGSRQNKEVSAMTNEMISAKMELKELVDVFSNLADVKDI